MNTKLHILVLSLIVSPPLYGVRPIDELRRCAEDYDRECQYELGFALSSKKNAKTYYTKANTKESATWLIKSASQGYAPAQSLLGTYYIQGKAVDQDANMALKLFRKAAKQGNAKAQYQVGLHFYYGVGVDENKDKALRSLKIAQKNGYRNAESAVDKINSLSGKKTLNKAYLRLSKGQRLPTNKRNKQRKVQLGKELENLSEKEKKKEQKLKHIISSISSIESQLRDVSNGIEYYDREISRRRSSMDDSTKERFTREKRTLGKKKEDYGYELGALSSDYKKTKRDIGNLKVSRGKLHKERENLKRKIGQHLDVESVNVSVPKKHKSVKAAKSKLIGVKKLRPAESFRFKASYQDLRAGESFKLFRKTPLMPHHSPSDPLSAIAKILYLPPDMIVQVLEVRIVGITKWYKVYVSGVGEGWINTVALY